MVPVYDKMQAVNNGSKILASYFDIVIDIVFLQDDVHNAEAIWNDNFSPGKLEGGSILDSNTKFFGKMNMHRYRTSFVLRYRALWDKIMGFTILIFSPTDYDSFYESKRKKSSFKKLAQKHLLTQPYIREIIEMIDGPLMRFDEKFRTPEAHGTGSLRKWAFLMYPARENPAVELLGYANMLNKLMYKLRSIFDEYNFI